MIWLSIILGILQAIPSLITIFKEIWDAIHGNPMKVAALVDLAHNIKAAPPAAQEAAMQAFHGEHVPGSKFAAAAKGA